jgi:NAD(P)-dependent dehydrogenase (short-subunit alcohol dehydrogenase family)
MIHAACLPNDQQQQHHHYHQSSHHLHHTLSLPALRKAVPLSAAYAASKFAIQGYFSSLACERPDLRIDLLCRDLSTPISSPTITMTAKAIARMMTRHRQDGQTSGTFQDENARGPLRCIDVVS